MPNGKAQDYMSLDGDRWGWVWQQQAHSCLHNK